MSGAGDIFGGDDGIPDLGPKSNTGGPTRQTATESVGRASDTDSDAREEAEAVVMRGLARKTGFAGKTIYDYRTQDHIDAARKPKTFTGNPETVLECFKEFCKLHGKEDKDALYEAFKLLGEKYEFAPLAELAAWGNIRKR